mmetsp:Transcript_8621/g.29604  ORF Transcript_8621/g.29604 Transcript_8621/m.29604 type:complete len:451 (-) Transcript_8621:116-1468(-)
MCTTRLCPRVKGVSSSRVAIFALILSTARIPSEGPHTTDPTETHEASSSKPSVSSTASPARANPASLWPFLDIDFTVVSKLPGITETWLPTRTHPVASLPVTMTCPAPPPCFAPAEENTGTRSGASLLCSTISNASMASTTVGPSNQDRAEPPEGLATTLSPVVPEAHSHRIRPSLKPQDLRKGSSLPLISASLSAPAACLSNLVTTTASWSIPIPFASCACSRVWPLILPRTSKPDSKPPLEPSTTRSAASAWEMPEMALVTKSRWPGASRMVICLASVSKVLFAMSMVTPLSLSSGLSSISQAQPKLPFPIWVAWWARRRTSFESTTPSSATSRPIRVDFPASTWPRTTSSSEGFPWGSTSRSRRMEDRSLLGSFAAAGLDVAAPCCVAGAPAFRFTTVACCWAALVLATLVTCCCFFAVPAAAVFVLVFGGACEAAAGFFLADTWSS